MKNVFTADLRGVDITEDQGRRIEAAIQDIVLKELGSSKVGSKRLSNDYGVGFRPEWYGIWIKQLDLGNFKIPDFSEPPGL